MPRNKEPIMLRWIKYGVIGAVVLSVGSLVVFGTDAWSYVTSGARAVRSSMRDNVPIEFELQRARDLAAQIVPEMQANIRLIAQEEVEIASLKGEIAKSESGVVDERTRIGKLASLMGSDSTVFSINERTYSRQAVRDDLARRFERFKEAEMVLESKRKLLATREGSLTNAMKMLDRTKHQKAMLEDKIESLAGQYRLVQASSVGGKFQMDSSKIARTQKAIEDIRKRLDVAERVLAHEGQFTENIEVDVVNEKDLLSQVNEHLSGGANAVAAGR
jgi:hypothetical protein